MAIGFKVNFFWYQIGNQDFLFSFFSTVAFNLENNIWGSRFPVIMKDLYHGEIPFDKIDLALTELQSIYNDLKQLPVDKVIWNIEDLKQLPPWGNNISNEIKNLGSYFVTSEGEDFITLLNHALEKAKELKTKLTISCL